jgi:CBS domain containing-hemolysin-like protein
LTGFTHTFFYLLLVFAFVLMNGFFVAAEFAIVKVRSTRIAQIHSQRGKMAQNVLAHLDAYLSATQLGITLASLGLGWVGEPAVARLLGVVFRFFHLPEWLVHPVSFAVAFTIITFLHIVLGEMAPKSIAIRKAEEVTLRTATSLHWFYRIFKPFIYILNQAANLVLRLMGIEMTEPQQAHTEEEIRMLIAQSHQSGVIDQTELTLFDNVFDFTDRVVREVMVPRVKMVCLYVYDSFAENMETIKNAHFTRFPLCGEDKDDVRGIVHIRDVYEHLLAGETPDLEKLVRPMIVVPETMELKDLLRELQRNKIGMAIVVDEYGGTSGLVTTEDIIEEIFGEIQDEFDDERPFFQKGKEGVSIEAGLLIDNVNDYFQIHIEDEDNDTIGGWLFSQLDKVPKTGDEVKFGDFVFKVEEMDQLRISRILVSKNPSPVPVEEEQRR